MGKNRGLGLGLVLLALTLPVALSAETIEGAMRAAYRDNPELNATRATVRAGNETIKQSRAGLLPQVNLQAAYGRQGQEIQNRWVSGDQASATLSASLLIYDGGQTHNGVRAAEADVAASLFRLKTAEQQTMLQAAQAYIGVLQAQSAIALNQKNIEQAGAQLRNAQIRFEVGTADASEQAQAEAALASARADLAVAEANLGTARADYRAVTGRPADDLNAIANIQGLPTSLDQAVALARANSPLIKAAIEAERAAQYRLRQAQGARLPSVNFGASGTLSDTLDGSDSTTSTQLGLNLSLPLYSGGRITSLGRQAEALITARAQDTNQARALVDQSTASAWANYTSSGAAQDALVAAVDAQSVAARTARIQYDEGILDLNSLLAREQALFSAERGLADLRHTRLLAGYQLLFAMGVLGVDGNGSEITPIDALAPVSGESQPSQFQKTIDGIADRWSR